MVALYCQVFYLKDETSQLLTSKQIPAHILKLESYSAILYLQIQDFLCIWFDEAI